MITAKNPWSAAEWDDIDSNDIAVKTINGTRISGFVTTDAAYKNHRYCQSASPVSVPWKPHRAV